MFSSIINHTRTFIRLTTGNVCLPGVFGVRPGGRIQVHLQCGNDFGADQSPQQRKPVVIPAAYVSDVQPICRAPFLVNPDAPPAELLAQKSHVGRDAILDQAKMADQRLWKFAGAFQQRNVFSSTSNRTGSSTYRLTSIESSRVCKGGCMMSHSLDMETYVLM